MLAVEGLRKRFGSKEVFRELTFQLVHGDALVVLGRNGSGKSTLLRILAGLLQPTEGTVRLPEGDLRTMLGWSSLDLSAYPHLSVRENLELVARLRGCDSRTEELSELFGLGSRLGQQARELSTGLRNRLKVALAIQAKPTVLLLDEPGASLDAEGKAVIDIVCREQRKRGVLVIATNDPDERRLASVELELAG